MQDPASGSLVTQDHIARVEAKGLECPAVRLIKLAEKFNELEPRAVRVSAKRVDEQAEHMEHKEHRAREDAAEDRADDAKPAERIIHHAADEVEHHAHRA